MFMSILQKKAFLILRILLGWVFLYAGLSKIFTADWSAAGFLHSAKTFLAFYSWLTTPGILPIVNFLNEWGLTLLGISLILGIFVRWSSIAGIILMILYYFAVNQFPSVASGFLVDEHVIYAAGLLLTYAWNAGRIWGLDEVMDKKGMGDGD